LKSEIGGVAVALLDKAIASYQAFFENLTDETVEDLRILATPHVRYRDPTMDSKGIDAVTASMHKWFRDLNEIQFEMKDSAVDGLVGFQNWIMRFRIRKLPKRLWEIDGMSKVTFNENGKIIDQVDYWDTSPIFASVPVLGKIVTLIKEFFS
jgi:limonene-1,2-epoxide hydrolase